MRFLPDRGRVQILVGTRARLRCRRRAEARVRMEFIETICLVQGRLSRSCHCVYDDRVPKLWTDTVEEHRRAVRDATLDATAKLLAGQGLASVPMSKIAAEAGIGRATLYKYFPDLESILIAWHERQVASHLEQLAR